MTTPTEGEPVATPLPRIGWRTQSVLYVLLEDPSREVWPYWVDRQTRPRSDSYSILQGLAQAGWVTSRRETDKPNARVLYRLTPSGEALAREAVQRPVKWPDAVAHLRPGTVTPCLAPASSDAPATPLNRIGPRTRSLLAILLADPDREVWAYQVNQQLTPQGDIAYTRMWLKRLAELGWLTVRHETGTPNPRTLYKLTRPGQALACQATNRPAA